MMAVVQRWKVSVTLDRVEDREVVFWIFDNHVANVLRKVSEMQFTEKGLVKVLRIAIEDEP